MDKKEIEKIVLDALEMANNARDDDEQIPVSPDTQIYGSDGHLDSMGLIAFLIDIEETLMDSEIQITLSDERAMSQSRSPFRDVQSLVDYINELIKDTK